MSLLDIVGPVMIGPSSSHTAGAVRIGLLARRLWGQGRPLTSARFYLRGSFAATYWGHGTDCGLVAGVLGMLPDDLRIPHSFDVACDAGLDLTFESETVDGAHPNSARIVLSDGAKTLEMVGASVGGGAVELRGLDGFAVNVPFGAPVLITLHDDVPGVVAWVTGEVYRLGVNLAAIDVSRQTRGGQAVGVFVFDGAVPDALASHVLSGCPACRRAVLLRGEEASA